MYVSTRDISKQQKVDYTVALLEGLAPDGGLFVPSRTPTVDNAKLNQLTSSTYPELFTYIKGLFIDGAIPESTQAQLAAAAYTKAKFPTVQDENYTPVRELQPGLFLQNLSLGPTAAFKDMALQPLSQDMNYVLSKQNKTLRILGATSGDTGSAAEAGIKDLERLSLFMLSPESGMSDFQKAQMGALSGGNIHNISVRGRFDDCQDLVKTLNKDPEFADLGAVNSINWGRIASQIPYYFSGYLQTVGNDIGKEIDVVVPTGNFGNILAGYYARSMGLPIRKLIIATNENDVLDRLVKTGIYSLRPAEITSSPSMDISKASNYERLVYHLTGNSAQKTRDYMKRFETKKSVSFADIGVSENLLRDNGFASGRSSHLDRLETIAWVNAVSESIIDPHTADAVKVARELRDADTPILCMETALPVKFETTIQEALGYIPIREPRFRNLEQGGSDTAFTTIEPDVGALKSYIRNNP